MQRTDIPKQSGFVNAKTGKAWSTGEVSKDAALEALVDKLGVIADMVEDALEALSEQLGLWDDAGICHRVFMCPCTECWVWRLIKDD